MVGSNPFFHRAPVRDPAFFFGREHETAQLFDLLGRGQSVSISGQRRLGKTSLLFHAALPEVAASHGVDPGGIRWVHLDGGMLDGLDDEAVYGAIVQSMGDGEEDSATYAQFLQRVRALAAQNLRLIIVLEEFEIFAQNLKFQPQLFNRLRGLTNQFPVQFVTASKATGETFLANPAAVSSAFVGIFAIPTTAVPRT
jgi:hypothetical protein